MNREMKNKVYNFIRDYIAENGYSPSLQEIGLAMGHHYATSRHYVYMLIEEGKIKKGPGSTRNLQVIG